MAQADPPPAPPAPEPSPPPRRPSRGPALLALVLLAAIVAKVGPRVWAEYRALQGDRDREIMTRVVGYPNIIPRPSFAEKPPDWIHDEGQATLLWSGWDPDAGRHNWFRVGRGELDPVRIAGGVGRDAVRAIDWPMIEVGGGKFWQLIPPEHPVASLRWAGVEAAYPLRVLERVGVVNDMIGETPLLVAYIPFVPRERAVSSYGSTLDGHRVTLGSAGYFHDRRPLLYDRETESLWVVRDDAVAAIAGRRKGMQLPRLGEVTVCSWGECRDQHPGCRLVVGADRSRGIPAQ
jgi:hypothetical protein